MFLSDKSYGMWYDIGVGKDYVPTLGVYKKELIGTKK